MLREIRLLFIVRFEHECACLTILHFFRFSNAVFFFFLLLKKRIFIRRFVLVSRHMKDVSRVDTHLHHDQNQGMEQKSVRCFWMTIWNGQISCFWSTISSHSNEYLIRKWKRPMYDENDVYLVYYTPPKGLQIHLIDETAVWIKRTRNIKCDSV